MKKNAKAKTVTVFIPKENKHDDALFVAVNGRRLLVRKGEPVELAECFAEVIRHSQEAKKHAEDYIDRLSNGG